MLANAIDRCAGDPQCSNVDPDARLAGVDGSFAGVQLVMVALAGMLVVLALVALILWLRRTSRGESALFAVAPDAAAAPASDLASAGARLARLDDDHAVGLVGEIEYVERRAAILSGA